MNTNRPNVIYILADDMGYGDVSAINEKSAFKTPNLDEMCTNGCVFTDCHASSSVCTPSRYSLLTGRYNWRSRLKTFVLGGYSTPLIENDRMTIGHLFKKNGYKTAAIGKWHLGMDFAKEADFAEEKGYETSFGVNYSGKIENSPTSRGFDYYFGISASLDMPPYSYIENDHFTMVPDHNTEGPGKKICGNGPTHENQGSGIDFWRHGPTSPDFKHEEVLQTITKKALEKIEEYKDGPFFIYFPLTAPHSPILPSGEFKGRSGTNEYGDFVLMCDDVVGQVTKKLKEYGIYENTIVIYTADNGVSPMANLTELASFGHNPSYIFRGHKADIYEGGHRIPFIIRWPEKIKPAGRCDKIVCLSDFMATMADYFGFELEDNMAEDSVSNLPLWMDPEAPGVRNDVVHHSINGSLSIRKGNFKLEMCPGSGGWSHPIPGEEDENMPRFQLYDLENDIKETTNLIDKYPEVFKELKDLLKKYILEGRSTPGAAQKNDGAAVWETIKWIEEE